MWKRRRVLLFTLLSLLGAASVRAQPGPATAGPVARVRSGPAQSGPVPSERADPARSDPSPCSTSDDNKVFLEECRAKAQTAELAGHPREALETYQQAYQRIPTPRLLWPMANLHLRLSHPKEGLAALDRYLIEIPQEDLPPGQRETALQLRQELLQRQEELARLARRDPLRADNDSAEPPKVAGPLAPPAQPGSGSSRPVYKRWWFWTTLGGGAVAIIALGLGVGLSQRQPPLPPGVNTFEPTF